jgi:protein SCO1/2
MLIAAILLAMIALLALTRSEPSGAEPTTRFRATNTPNAGAGESTTLLDPGVPMPDVSMPSTTGGQASLTDFQGKTLLVYFGYTHCPDFCPITMSQFAAVRAALGDLAADVQGVMISVDPARDTPEVLAAYVTQFDNTFIGLQADETVLDALQPTFGVQASPADDGEVSAAGYLVDHTVSSYVVDHLGNLRVIFSFGTPTGDMTEALRTLLTETQAAS